MFVENDNFPPLGICSHDELKWGRKKETIGGHQIMVCGRCREEIVDVHRSHAPTIRDAIRLIEKMEECDGMPAKLTLLRNFILFAAGRLSDWP